MITVSNHASHGLRIAEMTVSAEHADRVGRSVDAPVHLFDGIVIVRAEDLADHGRSSLFGAPGLSRDGISYRSQFTGSRGHEQLAGGSRVRTRERFESGGATNDDQRTTSAVLALP